MNRTTLDHSDVQGGKIWGELKKKQSDAIEIVIEEIIKEDTYSDVEDLDDKLANFKEQFMRYDIDGNGDLGVDDVRMMMETLGQPKNHLEIKKIIKEVDLNGSGSINFNEFVIMMLGKKSSILRKILMFEEMAKEKEKPTGLPPKKTFADLP